MARTIVGVVRGGTSSEYDLSLKTGAAILSALPDERYETRDIFIDKQGLWYLRGTPATPARALAQIDVVLNALHGGVGEDGTVQRLLQRSGVPFAGSSAASAALALNKIRSRELLQKAGVRVPLGASFSLKDDLTTADMAHSVFSQFGPPYVVKPSSEGASEGIVIALTLRDLPDVLGDVLEEYGSALVEEYIRGKEASVGVIEHFRNENLYALPPAEVVVPEGHQFLPRTVHEEGNMEHVVPSTFSFKEKDVLMNTAREAHRALGLSHFSRSDLIVTPRSVYLLEVNSIPGLYPGASFPKMLDSVGVPLSQFLEHAIALATDRT